MERVLIALLTLGVGAWVGGFITIFVVSRSSKAALNPAERVSLFRALGRRYAVVAGVAMALIVVPAAVLSVSSQDKTIALTVLVVAVGIIAASVPAVMQARRMGRLRRTALDAPNDVDKATAVKRGALSAAALRTALGIGSLSLLVLAVVLIGTS